MEEAPVSVELEHHQIDRGDIPDEETRRGQHFDHHRAEDGDRP